jgi:hypothetical protein
MRKAIGWFCYITGGGMIIFSLQLMINCEFIGAYRREKEAALSLWQYLYQTSGNHRGYPNGSFLHWTRDIFLFLFGSLIIRLGRELFVVKRKVQVDRQELVVCPACGRKTFADAYCRFCGLNLVTLQTSEDYFASTPSWKLSLWAYTGLSLLLLILNLLLVKLGWL